MNTERIGCQYTFINLLRISDNSINSTAHTNLIKQLLEDTPPCDKFSDLSDIRNTYVTKLEKLDSITNNNNNINIIDRIKNVSSITSNDQKIVLKTTKYYHKWTRDRLLSSLSITNRIYYHLQRNCKIMADLTSALIFVYDEHKINSRKREE